MRLFSNEENEQILEFISNEDILGIIKRLDVKHKKIAESTVQISKFLLDKRNEDQYLAVYSRRGVLTSLKFESGTEFCNIESKKKGRDLAVKAIKGILSLFNPKERYKEAYFCIACGRDLFHKPNLERHEAECVH